jgi:DNA-binding NtrC family response regulator
MVEDVTMKPSKYTILVVDDEERLRNLIVTFLSKLGHSCVTAIDGVDALDKMKGNKIDAVVTDMKMPNMDGITLAAKISIQYPELPVMVMTAFEEEHAAGVAITVGARDFIKKPFSLDEFAIRLHKMINDSEAERRMKRKKDVDKDIQKSINELEPPKQTKREDDVDKFIQEFINEVPPPKGVKREKGVDDGTGELLGELEEKLKKI